MAASKVYFGISNVHYAVLDEEEGTYGTPVPIYGAVKLSLEKEGEESKFYADNTVYYTSDTNAGYTGSLEMALFPDQFLIDVLGFVRDGNGGLMETTESKAKPFALLYEVDGNASPTRFVFYKVTPSRPTAEANTKTDTTEVDTQTMSISMAPQAFSVGGETMHVVKNHITDSEASHAAYAAFYTGVMGPKAVAA